jgi:hypothetical protein
MLAMSILAIVLSSSVVPNVRVQVQREKELEMVYRGEQMALGIARYYGRGNPIPLQILVPPEYGYLTDMKKLREGMRIGVREIKFVRPSAFIDPMVSAEWEPVRARDPRIMKFLQAYAAETQTPIPQSYLLIAGPPTKLHLAQKPPGESGPGVTPTPGQPGGAQPAQPVQPGQQPPPGQPPVPPGQPAPPTPPTGAIPRPGVPADPDDDDSDDDEEEDEEDADPLGHLFGSDGPGQGNVPIVGVAPRLKGKAIRPLYGLENYEEWVFIFMPRQFQTRPGGINQPFPRDPRVPGVPPRRPSPQL